MTSLNESILTDSLLLAQQQLQGFVQSENFWTVFESVFGTEYDRTQATAIQQAWQASDFSQLPEIQVLDSASMPGIQGGFSAETGKIYINADFLANATADQITAVLIEEIGHSLDSRINVSDTLGDEGELFSAYIRGIEISEPALAAMQSENDHVEGVVDGIPLVLEASSLRVGYYDMSLGSGNASQVEAIQAAGHIPILITSLSDAELASINMLVVQNPDNGGFGSEYLARLSAINSAVESGLTLIIHDRYVDSAETILPGSAGFNIVRDFSDYSNINFIDDNHSVASGPGGNLNDTSLDQGGASSHGFALSGTLPVDADLILSQGDASKIVTFSYKHGNGHVIYSSIPLDHYIGQDVIGNGGTGGIVRNAEEYAANLIDYAAVDLGNKAPTGSATASLVAGTEDTAYTITKAQLLAGFSDVNSANLFITDFTTSNGSFVANADGSYTITPTLNSNGLVTVNYKVSDGSLSVNGTNSFTLNAVNDAPTGSATASLVAGTEDTAYNITKAQLLAGFSDVDNANLSITDFGSSNGSFVVNADGSYTITPTLNSNGLVTVNYKVSDGSLSVDASNSFNLAAVNDAPTGSATESLVSGTEDTAYTISKAQLLAGFSDADGLCTVYH